VLNLLPKITPRAVSRITLNLLHRQAWLPFTRKLNNAAAVQREWVMNRVRLCRETGFGMDHGFSAIRSLADFQRQVPVASYDAFEPYINAVAEGNTSALIPDQEQLLQFTITTGSTGVPKLNPVTNTWLNEYRNAWNVWGLKMFVDHPQHIGSKMLQMSGTWNMGTTKGGYRISMVSALLTRIQNPLLKPYSLIPDFVNTVPDPVARHYLALRLSILEDVGWILLMNPGTLIRLADIGDTHAETLLKDLADGTLTTRFDIPDAVRRELAVKHLKPNPRGARRLAAIASYHGRLLPKDYWKQPTISCWLGGTAGFQSRYLSECFGASPLRDMGLVSSEGRHTIPISDGVPVGVPSIESGFYEFIPVAESGTDQPNILEGHELVQDHEYRILMTTSAGYFRFDIGDIVKCRGFVGEAPLLEFVQKSARVGDLEGEKVTEHQVVEAAHAAAGTLGLNPGFVTAIPRRLQQQQPRYDFLAEATSFADQHQAKLFLENLDTELARLNFLWKARRREGVLQSPHLQLLAANEWDRTIQKEVDRRGTGDYQYKHPGLVLDESWINQFRVQSVVMLD